jgi:mono/diheme cytochrome c family protein
MPATVAATVLTLLVPLATPSTPAPEGRALYQQRCAACHDQDRPDVPSRQQMATRTVAFIVDKLAFGSMQTQALGLSDAQIEQLASYLATGGAPFLAPGRRVPLRSRA